MKTLLAAAVIMAISVIASQAQNPAHPYAGLQGRPIKALSEQQVADLRAGHGMSLALPAELNGYPGPVHALELADALLLSADQRFRLRELFEAMRAEAVPLGETVISREAELDRHFAERTITPENLQQLTAELGRLQGSLRAAHLRYHLATLDILTPQQADRYAELRGYRTGIDSHHGRNSGK
jgi:Spy/CpxP family protein refolding chaperone